GGYYQPPSDPDPGDAQPVGGPYGYVGIHPIPYQVGGGFCTLTGPHQHPYQPFDAYLFRQVNGYYYFVGDPSDFGYGAAGQSLYWYRGEHPIPAEYGDGFCYISWPHRHPYTPPEAFLGNYRQVGGYYVYRGPFAQPYYQHRDAYSRYFHNYYRSYY